MSEPETPAARAASAVDGAFGQGPVVATPQQMARVAATIAAGGAMPEPTVLRDSVGGEAPRRVLRAGTARVLSAAMRDVVRRGTARQLAGAEPGIAGKTGTAQVHDGRAHAWFVGFAPDAPGARRIAFAVLLENGGYGGSAAAAVAGRIVAAAHAMDLAR
jgi:peptidoglycan glycosyltransferase